MKSKLKLYIITLKRYIITLYNYGCIYNQNITLSVGLFTMIITDPDTGFQQSISAEIQDLTQDRVFHAAEIYKLYSSQAYILNSEIVNLQFISCYKNYLNMSNLCDLGFIDNSDLIDNYTGEYPKIWQQYVSNKSQNFSDTAEKKSALINILYIYYNMPQNSPEIQDLFVQKLCYASITKEVYNDILASKDLYYSPNTTNYLNFMIQPINLN